MRKTFYVLIAAALVLGITSAATAGTFVPEKSTIRVRLGALPEVFLNGGTCPNCAGGTGTAMLSDDGMGGHILTDEASVWASQGFGAGTAFFTGVPLITNVLFSITNEFGVMGDGFSTTMGWVNTAPPGSGFGGFEPINGAAIISVGGAIMATVTLDAVGGPAGGMISTVVPVTITATAGPFVTNKITVTDITTNVVSIPMRAGVTGVPFTLAPTPNETVMTFSTMGGFVSLNGGLPVEQNTVMVSGSNSLGTASGDGMVTLVSPLRVNTGTIAGRLPLSIDKKFVFAPEPGTLLLLASGAVGLLLVGRARMRK